MSIDIAATFSIPGGVVREVSGYWLYCPQGDAVANGGIPNMRSVGMERYFAGPYDGTVDAKYAYLYGLIPLLPPVPTIFFSKAKNLFGIVLKPGDIVQVQIGLQPIVGMGANSPVAYSAQWQIPDPSNPNSGSGLTLQAAGIEHPVFPPVASNAIPPANGITLRAI